MIAKTALSYKALQSRQKEVQGVEDRDIEADISKLASQTFPFNHILAYVMYTHILNFSSA